MKISEIQEVREQKRWKVLEQLLRTRPKEQSMHTGQGVDVWGQEITRAKEKMDNQLDVFGGNNQQVFRTLLQDSEKKNNNNDPG